MVRIINANPGMGAALTEEEAKDFMIGHTIIHIGTVDKKGEPNVVPTGYYFDKESNEIYIPTQKGSKKVENLGKKNIISFCVDDTNPPYKGVRGKGKVKIHEDTNYNRNVAKKLLLRSVGSLELPTAKWLLNEIEEGRGVMLEITPNYYSTWDYGKAM
jgi:nitroimidazol reductase NimA-like FMN-containing flavoprotein (pyridoxamine 5'-phosphate oxidase superfamily)